MVKDDNIEFFNDPSGRHRWKIRDDNGDIIAICYEGYSSKANAINSLLMTHTLLSRFIAEMAKKGVHAD